jgi:hypothetical protein
MAPPAIDQFLEIPKIFPLEAIKIARVGRNPSLAGEEKSHI